MTPLLSIIIINYNTGKLLWKCIESVKETTEDFKSPNCEVIVVDNASSDEGITSITGTMRIKAIQNKENRGFARAVNQGIKKAKGEYILLLNPDTEVKDKAILKMVEFAKKADDVGVVGARLINPDSSTQPSVFRFPTPWRAFQEFWLGKALYSKYVSQGKEPTEVDAVVGAAFLMTPKAREQVGLLDERYFMYFEDLDYCRRVKRAGLRVYYLPSAQVVHYHGVSGRRILGQKNEWRRLIPGSKTYHGVVEHSILSFIIWSGQKWQKFLHRN